MDMKFKIRSKSTPIERVLLCACVCFFLVEKCLVDRQSLRTSDSLVQFASTPLPRLGIGLLLRLSSSKPSLEATLALRFGRSNCLGLDRLGLRLGRGRGTLSAGTCTWDRRFIDRNKHPFGLRTRLGVHTWSTLYFRTLLRIDSRALTGLFLHW
ncbi:hypothetical protein AG1IA_08779 [Rhizoctonia solani AG-1 IA]|uniref:Uncharacterized protein n=1 Tax=Thanatephorus cucumeris (strain AG1-IA) TaxID=983506 RepID=L8WG68_THACA|nr:hypothetical protein AG1IA_08779 [Rhizoctonia solani AG-1 IA]